MCWRADAPAAVLVALLCLPLASGCGGEAPAVAVPATVLEDDDSAPATTRSRLHVALVEERRASTFPHERHVGLECVRCHTQVPGHGAHSSVACLDCHEPVASATPEATRAASGDCSSCHHAPAQGFGCRHCHDSRSLPSEASVEVTARFAAGSAGQVRRLPFSHALHGAIECVRCHGREAHTAAPASCATCHQRHHTATASCAGCHPTPRPGVHPVEAHLGCAGAGCHDDAAVAELPLVRAVCVVCHRAQSDHETGAECASCHAVRPQARAAPEAVR
ncbi:MAG TPA: hypothetical protein VK939_08015 [Longimicrobiales bacterium]|nr:hypothetical protein [Longimicrobiales bacterium]